MLDRLGVVSQKTVLTKLEKLRDAPTLLGYASRKALTGVLAICISIVSMPAKSQILPEVWATVGSADDSLSYGAGARFAGAGIEVGTGENGSTGADFLTFINLPVVSPYVGIGYYDSDEDFAYSGGLHLNAGRRLTIGAGYHSVRGPNGQLGFRF